eukprot:11320756-Karenia_brevis.AAC.1
MALVIVVTLSALILLVSVVPMMRFMHSNLSGVLIRSTAWLTLDCNVARQGMRYIDLQCEQQ